MKIGISFFLLLLILLPACNFSAGPLTLQYSQSRQIFDSSSKLLRLTLSDDDQYRLWVSSAKAPESLKEAFLFKEDRYFYWHPGFNPISLLRSFIQMIYKSKPDAGASTITMQLARLHYRIYTRSIFGKLKQIAAAYWLEILYTKEEIFEGYLNLAPFGRNIQGVKAASRIYFKKSLEELSLLEMFFLSSIPQRPSILNHIEDSGPLPKSIKHSSTKLYQAYAKKNEIQVLDDLLRLPYLIQGVKSIPFKAPHFSDQILRRTNKNDIYSSLVLNLQNILSKTVFNFIEKHKKQGLQNASLVLLNYKTMKIEAMIGSKDFFNDEIFGQVNGVISQRSPGSTLKPLIYAMAMEQGLIIPESIVFDAPLSFRTPENYDQVFRGPISAKNALITSRNVPAVHLSSLLTKPNLFEFLSRLYPGKFTKTNHYGSSLALGGAEFSLLELAKLYAMFANKGEFKEISWLKDEPPKEGPKLLKSETIAMMMEMLGHNQRPGLHYDKNFVLKGTDVYWKTGTSFGFRDAWSVGVVGPYILGVWVGNFSGQGNPSLIGARAAAPLFFEAIDKLTIPTHYGDLHSIHENITEVEVCAVSGFLPQGFCPHKKLSLFYPGISPIKKCAIHREIEINTVTGLQACLKTEEKTRKSIVEVWPSHIMEIFAKLGIPRKPLPPFGKECNRQSVKSIGAAPKIIKPHRGLKYTFRKSDKENLIVFKAQADNSSVKLHWYVDDSFLGSFQGRKEVYWKARPGKFKVRVVDDLGRQASRSLTVLYLDN